MSQEMMIERVEQAFAVAAERGRALRDYQANPESMDPPMGLAVAEAGAAMAMEHWRDFLAGTSPAALSAEPSTSVEVPDGLRLVALYREFAGQRAALDA